MENMKTTAAGTIGAGGAAALALDYFVKHDYKAGAAFAVLALGIFLKGIFAKDA